MPLIKSFLITLLMVITTNLESNADIFSGFSSIAKGAHKQGKGAVCFGYTADSLNPKNMKDVQKRYDEMAKNCLVEDSDSNWHPNNTKNFRARAGDLFLQHGGKVYNSDPNLDRLKQKADDAKIVYKNKGAYTEFLDRKASKQKLNNGKNSKAKPVEEEQEFGGGPDNGQDDEEQEENVPVTKPSKKPVKNNKKVVAHEDEEDQSADENSFNCENMIGKNNRSKVSPKQAKDCLKEVGTDDYTMKGDTARGFFLEEKGQSSQKTSKKNTPSKGSKKESSKNQSKDDDGFNCEDMIGKDNRSKVTPKQAKECLKEVGAESYTIKGDTARGFFLEEKNTSSGKKQPKKTARA